MPKNKEPLKQCYLKYVKMNIFSIKFAGIEINWILKKTLKNIWTTKISVASECFIINKTKIPKWSESSLKSKKIIDEY